MPFLINHLKAKIIILDVYQARTAVAAHYLLINWKNKKLLHAFSIKVVNGSKVRNNDLRSPLNAITSKQDFSPRRSQMSPQTDVDLNLYACPSLFWRVGT